MIAWSGKAKKLKEMRKQLLFLRTEERSIIISSRASIYERKFY